MDSTVRVSVRSDADIVQARSRGRELAASLGFTETDQTIIATAISELARNIVLYAGSGEIALASVVKNGRSGLRVVAVDAGPGILDLEMALREGYSTSRSLGLGLPGVKRLMDEFEVRSVANEGTTITAWKWNR